MNANDCSNEPEFFYLHLWHIRLPFTQFQFQFRPSSILVSASGISSSTIVSFVSSYHRININQKGSKTFHKTPHLELRNATRTMLSTAIKKTVLSITM